MAKHIERVSANVLPHWVGDGFPVRSLFSYQEGSAFDPFLMLDYAGPHEFAPTQATRGVSEHPHRGFETVTIVYQGEIEHRDSSGSHGTIGPGDVQWMTAASGVVHEEFHSERFTRQGGTLEMIQLWVNLPAKDKMSAPRYQGILNADIPRVSLGENVGEARVIAGELLGVRGAAQTFTPIDLWELSLQPGAELTLPAAKDRTSVLVVQQGGALLDGSRQVDAVSLVLFSREGEGIELRTQSGGRFVFLSGEPIGEPVVGRGPFVMNTREEIQQAIHDYQAGRMGQLG